MDGATTSTGAGLVALLAAPVAGLLGALVGASASIMLENHRRRRDGQMTAVAAAASIETVLWMTERRRHVPLFRAMLAKAKSGEVVQFSGVVDENQIMDPIADRLMDRLGLLHPELASRLVKFFTILHGIRVDILNLRRDCADMSPGEVVRMLEEDLALWEEANDDGKQLITDLRSWASHSVRSSISGIRMDSRTSHDGKISYIKDANVEA